MVFLDRKYMQSVQILIALAARAGAHLIELFMADDVIMVEVKLPKQVFDSLQACRRALQQFGISKGCQLQADIQLSACYRSHPELLQASRASNFPHPGNQHGCNNKQGWSSTPARMHQAAA